TNGEHIFTPTGNGAKILNTSIETQLNKGTNVTIKTSGANTTGQSGDIVVNASISKTKGGDATLTLNADRSILVNTNSGTGNITSTAGKLHVKLLAGGSSNGTVVVGRQIDTNGGDLSIGGVTGDNGQAPHQVAIRLKGDSSIKAGNVSIAGASTQGITTSGGTSGNVSGIDFWGTIDATGNVTIKSADQINISRNENTTGDAVKGNIVKIESDAGNINLNRSNISAVNDITLKAGAGSITVSGTNTTIKANINSTNGNISLNAHNPETGSVTGINLRNTNITAREGNITVNGTTPGQYSGVRLQNINMLANSKTGVIDIYGESSGVSDTAGEQGSLRLGGVNNFGASMTKLHGKNMRNTNDVSKNTAYLSGAGLAFYADSGSTANNAKTSFTGNVQLTGESVQGLGINFFRDKTWLSFSNGNVDITGRLTGEAVPTQGGTSAAIGTHTIYGRNPAGANIELNNSNLLITADATSTHNHKIPGFAATTPEASENFANGFTFTGSGNVHIIGKSNKAPGVNTRVFNNTGLHGNFTVEGSSTSGNGVEMDKRNLINLSGATIKGSSENGYGVFINNADGKSLVDLNNNVIQGTSITSDGINIKGDNVTITNGTLKGSATSGTGAGISLNGGNNYTFDGVTVTGQSADGTGVSVGGTLTVNNGTVVNGTSSGSGTGVSVAGTLTTAEGADVTLNGKSESGDGVQVTGDTSLNHATVNGTSVSGTGLNVSGNASLSSAILTGSTGTGTGAVVNGTVNADERSEINGLATAGGGTGVSVGGVLNGGSVNGSSTTGNAVHVTDGSQINGTDIRGTSQNGSAIKTEGQVSVNNSQLSGHSVNGADLDVSGMLSLG
ncbi:hypothetical protein M4W28_004593, partial [Salmonella enterica]|nr:hypothetical protein [Salmonella enterica]